MKKLLSLLLATLMIVTLTACGSDADQNQNADTEDGAPIYELTLGTDCSDPALSPDYNGYGMQWSGRDQSLL